MFSATSTQSEKAFLPPWTLSNNTISYLFYISWTFPNGQTVYLSYQPAHWCVQICVGFLFFERFQLSAALSLIIVSVADASPLLCGVTEDVLLLAFHLSKVKVWARHPPVDVLDVITGGLKVSCGVVWTGDEDLEWEKRSNSKHLVSAHRDG